MLRCVLSALACLTTVSGAAGDEAASLVLADAWHVEGPGRFDASGLLVRDGSFFVVSDRHGDTIFRLEVSGDIARARPFVTFTGPDPYPAIGYMDIEGIASAPGGGFYLASEWGFAVCEVPGNGGVARWVTPGLQAVGAAAGLFATKDAYVEGVAVLGPGEFLIAAERAPRGLIEVGGNPPWRIAAQSMQATRYEVPAGRGTDWADLTLWQGRVFGLARNQHLVVELLRAVDTGAWMEGRAWSYASAENAPERRYTDMTYGQGEGLAITDEHVYVLIDNNNLPNADQPGDRRGWLLAFPNPIAR